MKNHYYFILVFLCSFQLFSQQLSPKASVSVITCGPGTELYSTFGHSAFRVHDSALGLDRIYNYGTFDFNAPNFYVNFAKGKLTYQLSTSTFGRFLRIYSYENRWVKEQQLALTTTEVQSIFNFLENNAKPSNRDYQYDFFYDNCSTKIEEVIKKVLNDKVAFSNEHISTTKTHRDLIADYTETNVWSKFGIDLALGSVIDKKATKDDYKFLPDYIFQAFEHATITNGDSTMPLVKKTTTILKEKPAKQSQSIVTPFTTLLAISMVILGITFFNYKKQKRTKLLDFVLYLTTGIIGIVVLLLWFATSHTATYRNFNFLWAFTPNVVIAFYVLKSKLPQWIRSYNWLLIGLIVLMGMLWILQFQVYNFALIPFIIALAFRYLFLIQWDK
jgi:hypothetical protein